MLLTRTEPNIARMATTPDSDSEVDQKIVNSQSLKSFAELSRHKGSGPRARAERPHSSVAPSTACLGCKEPARRPKRWKSINTFRNALSAFTAHKR